MPCCTLERKHRPRLYNHLSKSAFVQMERRTACHFSETNVQKHITPKTISSSLLSRAIFCLSLPKKQIRLKGADVPFCLSHIKEGNNNNMQDQSYRISLCAPAIPPYPSSLSFFYTISMAQPSHRVHVPWQCLSNSRPKEEKRGKWIKTLDLNLFRAVFFDRP